MVIIKYSKEVIYLQNIITFLNTIFSLNIPINIPIIIEDNIRAIKLGYNAEFYKRTKYINIKYHYIRELVKNNKIKILYINIKE